MDYIYFKNYFLWKKTENQVPIKQAFQKFYPWPLSSVLFLKEYYFNKNKLMLNKTWQKSNEQVGWNIYKGEKTMNTAILVELALVTKRMSLFKT